MSPIEPGVQVPVGSTATSDTPVTPKPDGDNPLASSAKRTRTRKRDAPPKPKPSRAQQTTSFTTAELEQALAEILTFPAVPCAMVGDEWAATHFSTQGRAFAANLAKQAEKNPTLHKWCVRIAQGESVGMLGMSAVMYMVPPLIHWGLIPVPAAAREIIPGMPPVKEQPPEETTAAAHMATEPGNTNNGSNAHTRQERHTP